ncbi:MAG: hypothetical protein AAF585_10215, partial [Verrucomicrobiota bacterium]
MRQTPSTVGERLGNMVNINAVRHPRYNWRATYIEAGRIKQKYFRVKAEAKRFKESRELEARESGTEHRLTAAERSAVIETREELAALG